MTVEFIKEKKHEISFISVKYGRDHGIKGKNRYIFEDALVRQIRYALQGVDGEFLVHKCHGRVYVDCDGDYDFDETVESLQKVFGIVGICPVVRVPVAELEQLRKDVVAYVDEAYKEKNMTFKVVQEEAKKSYPATLWRSTVKSEKQSWRHFRK